jgi:hypothetical protein
MTIPRPRRRRRRDDRGSVTSEMVVYSPLWFGLILLGVQLAVWGLAQLAVQHSANHALQVTRIVGGTERAGTADARTVLQQVGGRLVGNAQISVDRAAGTATVTVRGKAPAVVPFLRLSVSTSVSAPVERFYAN